MSLSLQVIGSTWLSPGRAVPSGLPLRTSARRKKATAESDDGLVIVTVVVRSPSSARLVAAATCTDSDGSVCSAVRSAYWLRGSPLLACGLPSVEFQSITSG